MGGGGGWGLNRALTVKWLRFAAFNNLYLGGLRVLRCIISIVMGYIKSL